MDFNPRKSTADHAAFSPGHLPQSKKRMLPHPQAPKARRHHSPAQRAGSGCKCGAKAESPIYRPPIPEPFLMRHSRREPSVSTHGKGLEITRPLGGGICKLLLQHQPEAVLRERLMGQRVESAVIAFHQSPKLSQNAFLAWPKRLGRMEDSKLRAEICRGEHCSGFPPGRQANPCVKLLFIPGVGILLAERHRFEIPL